MKKRFLFICMGNICRSPAAEGAMRALLQKEGLENDFFCDSAGTIGHHEGELPDERMRQQANKRGLTLNHRSRKFKVSDFENFDYLLVMDKKNWRDISSLDVENKYQNKIFMLTDFCQTMKASEVPDPYYGGLSGFDYVLDLVTDASNGLLKHARENHE